MSRSHGGWLRHGADTALQKRHMAATSAFKHVVVGLSKSPLTKPDDAPLRRYWEYIMILTRRESLFESVESAADLHSPQHATPLNRYTPSSGWRIENRTLHDYTSAIWGAMGDGGACSGGGILAACCISPPASLVETRHPCRHSRSAPFVFVCFKIHMRAARRAPTRPPRALYMHTPPYPPWSTPSPTWPHYAGAPFFASNHNKPIKVAAKYTAARTRAKSARTAKGKRAQ